MAKKAEVKRVRMSDEEADKFARKHEKDCDLYGKAATDYWRRYGARRLAALARDQRKNEKKLKVVKGKKRKAA